MDATLNDNYVCKRDMQFIIPVNARERVIARKQENWYQKQKQLLVGIPRCITWIQGDHPVVVSPSGCIVTWCADNNNKNKTFIRLSVWRRPTQEKKHEWDTTLAGLCNLNEHQKEDTTLPYDLFLKYTLFRNSSFFISRQVYTLESISNVGWLDPM